MKCNNRSLSTTAGAAWGYTPVEEWAQEKTKSLLRIVAAVLPVMIPQKVLTNGEDRLNTGRKCLYPRRCLMGIYFMNLVLQK